MCFCLSGQTDRAFVSYKGTVERLSVLDLDAAEIVSPKTAHVHIGSFYDCSGLRPGLRALLERVKADTAATVSLVPQSDSTADGEALEQLLALLPLGRHMSWHHRWRRLQLQLQFRLRVRVPVSSLVRLNRGN